MKEYLWLMLAALLSLPEPLKGDTCSERLTISVGLFFRCELTLQDFFSTDEAAAGSAIGSYRVHQDRHAGRPEWIQVLVPSPSRQELFLYRTPAVEGTVQLQEVAGRWYNHIDQSDCSVYAHYVPHCGSYIAYDDIKEDKVKITVQRSDFQVSSRSVQLTVEPLQGQIFQVVDLLVTNYEIAELLGDANFTRLEATLREVYTETEGAGPRVISLIDPRDRNIEAPEPPGKLGVFIQFTPGLDKSVPIATATEEEASSVQERCDGTPPDPALPPRDFNQFSARGFTVDWCQYAIQYLTTPTSSGLQTPPTSALVDTPTEAENALALIVIMAIVGVVICMAFCVVTCVCFCRRRDSLLTLPKTRRHKNKVILHETKRSVSDVNRAQVTLRQLSMRLATPTLGVALTEERPQSAETCLEYQDMPDGRNAGQRLVTPPPPYPFRHDDKAMTSTRSSSPD